MDSFKIQMAIAINKINIYRDYIFEFQDREKPIWIISFNIYYFFQNTHHTPNKYN